MPRLAGSTPADIAAGDRRDHRGEQINCLPMAMGSLRELETRLTIAVRVGRIELEATRRTREPAQEVGRVPGGLPRSLQA